MGDSKKEEKQLLFPHVELGTKPANEVWMYWETKLLAHLSINYPNQVVWILDDGLDEKKPVWGLKTVPDFKQWFDDLDLRYHLGPKPLRKDYTNPSVPPSIKGELRRSDYDQSMRFYLTRYDKYREKEDSKP